MRIIYLHQYFNTLKMSGGTRSYEMALQLIERGHEVHVISSNREASSDGKNWKDEVVEGITIHWIGIPYDNKMSFIQRIKVFLKFSFLAGKKAVNIGGDIVFATSTPLTIAIPAIKAKNELNIPMVFEVRDLWPELPISIGVLRNPILKYMAKKLELYAYRNSDAIIGLSPGMCKGVENTGYPKEKIYNIPNMSNIAIFQGRKKLDSKFKNDYHWLNDNHKLVVYFGTLGKINGVSYLVDIAKEFLHLNKNVKFLVVGTGIEESLVRTKAIKSQCYNKNFFMQGQVSKSQIPALFSVATISTSLFIPLKEMENNSANKFFDTLAAGKPIVINYDGWQNVLINQFNIGLTLDSDIKRSSILLNSLLLNGELLDKMGKNALALAKNQFSRSELTEKFADVLEGVCADNV